MTMAVGSSVATGSYPITVTASGGGITHTATVNLTTTSSSQAWQAGFDFRATQGFVTDPAGDYAVRGTATLYPTTGNGVTYGWASAYGYEQLTSYDLNAAVDPRLAGANAMVNNVSPAVFKVDLPAPGTYNVSLAIGLSDDFPACNNSPCQVEFRDGSTSLFILTIPTAISPLGAFVDANGQTWSAAAWPTSNTTRQITLAGTQLTMLLGTGGTSSSASWLSFLGLTQQTSSTPNFTVAASPTAVSVATGSSGSSTITTTAVGGFNSAISLSASGAPSGVTVSFNPTSISGGAGSSTMTMAVGSSVATGSYPITVTASGGGITHTATVNLTATSPSLTISPHVVTLTVGQQQQFTANMSASWSVDGIPGGSTTVGTISSSGLYTAPATAGSHTVTATGSGMTATAYAYVSNYAGVFTYHNDNARTGQNTQETALTPANVNSTQFGKLFSVAVEGNVVAQPLYVANLNFSGTIHNVVYVATENDNLYAIDADNGTILWNLSLIPSGASTGLISELGCPNGLFGNNVGITGTPVIDPASGTIYLVTTTKENGSYVQRLHAIDIINQTEKFEGPVVIEASVSGTGDSSSGGVVSFEPMHELQRPGLLLQNGQVSIGWAGYCDARPYHGWVITYNATNLTQQVGVFNDTPNGNSGGIWMSGGGLAGDANFNTYFATGNGDYNGAGDFGDSILKLGPPSNDSFPVADWFTPWDQATMAATDGDLGSGGVLLLPDLPSGSPHQHLLVEAGKEGTIYLIDRDNMGKFCSNCNGGDSQIAQELKNVLLNPLLATPAYWNGNVYFASESMPVLGFSFNAGGSGLLSTSPVQSSTNNLGDFGSSLVVSANGNSNGIVWALDNAAYPNCCQILHAYDAASLAELYNSNQAPNNRDTPGAALHFNVSMIADGKVFVASQNELVIYGLLPQ